MFRLRSLFGSPVIAKHFCPNFYGRVMSTSLADQFSAAKERVGALNEDPGNNVKLQLYALFKQGSVGACNTSRPGMIDFVGRAKWDAWNALGKMNSEEAMQKYIDVVNDLVKHKSSASESKASETTHESSPGSTGWITTSVEGKSFCISFNRPEKKNALVPQMYDEIVAALKASAENKDTSITVLRSKGDYFSSGNDLGNLMEAARDIKTWADKGKAILMRYVEAYIDHPKPLVALVQGPAIGISVTILGLFDLVYASDRATFNTPFSALGQSPEGTSSFMFPRIMGISKASDFLLFGRKLTAEEACSWGLVTEVFPDATFDTETKTRVQTYANLPPQSMVLSKRLIRDTFRKELHETNVVECERLHERWQSEECFNAVSKFFMAKSKV